MLSSDRLAHRRPPARDWVQSQFLAGRTACLDRLVRAGMQRSIAQGWIEAWDVSTAELGDFREATDFWTVGFSYAVEEYRRGYLPPLSSTSRCESRQAILGNRRPPTGSVRGDEAGRP